MIKGTDLSHWNTVVNYDQMVDYGIRFGCLKLGQGVMAKDDKFDAHRAGFSARHLPWDLYWFADYRYSGVVNANRLVEKAAGDYGAGHPVFDLEFYDGFGPRPDGWHMKRFALDFFGEFEAKTSILAMFYSNRDVINQIMATATAAEKAEFLRHELWLATHSLYGNPYPWPKYRLNQYELDLLVPWSNSTVDLNDFNGTEIDFENFYHHPAQLTLEQKVDVIEDEARAKGWILWEV